MTAIDSSSIGPRGRRPGAWVWWLASLWAMTVSGADLSEVRGWLRTGENVKAVDAAAEAVNAGQRADDWPMLLGQGLMNLGRYPEAYAAMTNALAKDQRSIRLRWLAREIAIANGEAKKAAEYLEEIKTAVGIRPGAYRDPASMVVFARAALLFGADPKAVLEKILGPATKVDPDLRDAYLARGEIALEKHDFKLAAKAFEEGLRKHSDDPDLLYGLARSHLEGDREVVGESLEAALKINPRHLPSLLLLADHRIDGEDYEGAQKALTEILNVNPWLPDAWCYRAVLAHLRNDASAESAARESALRYWTNNPRVDHLIGSKLSQKYRFTEGAARQRQALEFDGDYLPAKAQLANDLLRLGDETEGWRLAQEVHKEDGYDVAAFNLVTLFDTMTTYATLTNEHFIIRLTTREAEVYGPRVLALLERARTTLCGKYGMELKLPTLVEIFAEQKDFGVRTFGMPDNPGYLGVCFGRVITATGPAANKSGPVNWEAVLWHEFCHVVTLQMTANKMPRWLSEGISVYEELEENRSWGQRMTPRYRAMVLGPDFTPIAKLSGAFLAPKSPFHLQFAYYESALVVEFLVNKFGLEALKSVLRDLHDGVDINDALAKRTAPMEGLEKDFAAFARERAQQLAPGLDWEKPVAVAETGLTNKLLALIFPEKAGRRRPNAPSLSEEEMAKWADARPTNYWALQYVAQRLTSEKKWVEAKAPLQRLLELFPEQTGPESAYAMLAAAHRALGETNEERQVLGRYAERDHEASGAYLRLMELAAAAKDWPEVSRNSQRYLGVNPLVAPPYRYFAQASEATGNPTTAIAAYRTLLRLDPPNPADVHYQLARLLQGTDVQASRRHTLQALEEAPRHRAALQLLLKLPTNAPPAVPGAARR